MLAEKYNSHTDCFSQRLISKDTFSLIEFIHVLSCKLTVLNVHSLFYLVIFISPMSNIVHVLNSLLTRNHYIRTIMRVRKTLWHPYISLVISPLFSWYKDTQMWLPHWQTRLISQDLLLYFTDYTQVIQLHAQTSNKSIITYWEFFCPHLLVLDTCQQTDQFLKGTLTFTQ